MGLILGGGAATYQDSWAEVEAGSEFHFEFVVFDEVLAAFTRGRGDGFEMLGVPRGHVGEVEDLFVASGWVE